MEKEIRRHFSKIGFAYLAGSIVIYAVQFLASMVGKKFVPGVMADANGSFIVLMLTMYGISMPFMGWLVSRIPTQKIEERKMTAGQWIIAFLMCYGLMYAGNLIGTALTFGIGMVKGTGVDNPLVSTVMQPNPWVTFIIAVLIAPTAAELLFRKFLTERIVKYGELAAVLASGLFFGLFHGNLNQFSYAFLLGLLLAYVYYRTGLLRVSVALHMVLNFFGAAVSLLLPDCAASDMALGAFWMVSVVLGVILLVRGRKDQIWLHGPCAPDMRAVFGNAGMILVIVGCFVETALTF